MNLNFSRTDKLILSITAAMWAMTIAILLFAFGAHAQAQLQPQGISRGNALKLQQFQTNGAMTYFVDPTGSDSNACTASGTSACATLQGVVNKWPKYIRHNITVNIAAGTYTGNTVIANFVLGPDSTQGVATGNAPYPTTSGIITIQGPTNANSGGWTTPTIPTGTTTGTLTATPTAATLNPMVMTTWTDSTQSWTTDSLKGLYIVEGAAGGKRIITGNTATTLTTVGAGTIATSGTAYSIRIPSATIGALVIGNIQGTISSSGGIIISDLNIQTSNSPPAVVQVMGTSNAATSGALPPAIVFRAARVLGGTLSALSMYEGSYLATSSASTYFETTGPLALVNTAVSSGTPTAQLVDIAGYWRSTSTGILVSQMQGAFGTTSTSFPLWESNGAANPMLLYTPARGTYLWIRATGATTGLTIQDDTFGANPALTLCGLKVEGATTGIKVNSGRLSVGACSITAGTYTTSGVTNDINVDGTNYAWSTITGFTGKTLNTAYGSLVGQF